MYAHGYVYVCVHMYVCEPACEYRGKCHMFVVSVHLSSWDRVSHWTQSLPVQLNGLAIEPLVSFCPYFPGAGIACCVALVWVLEILVFMWQELYRWSVPWAPWGSDSWKKFLALLGFSCCIEEDFPCALWVNLVSFVSLNTFKCYFPSLMDSRQLIA
jgi:hypothetical protein